MNSRIKRQAGVVEVAPDLAVEISDLRSSWESNRCFETRIRLLSVSTSTCELLTFRVLPSRPSRTLTQTVF